MESKNEIINLLKEEIEKLEKYLKTIVIEDDEKIIEYKNFLYKNLNNQNFDFLTKDIIYEIKNYLSDELKVYVINLLFSSNSLSSKINKYNINNPINKADREQIKIILQKFYEYFKEKEQIIKNQKLEKEYVSKQKTLYNDLLEKINSDKRITKEELERIFIFLEKINDKEKAINLMIYIGEYFLETNNKQDEEELIDQTTEEIIEENKDLDEIEENLIKVFKEFDLDFTKLPMECQNLLKQFGKVDNINGILNQFQKYNVDFNDKYYGEPLIKSRAFQITKILIYSNPKILCVVLDYIQIYKLYCEQVEDKYGNHIKKLDYNTFLSDPGAFFEKKRRYKRRGTQLIDCEGKKNEPTGHAWDFIQNLELLCSKGVSPADYYKSKEIKQKPYEKLVQVLNVFKLHRIDERFYSKTLYCFHLDNQAQAIEQFIELGQLSYLLKNMSRCVKTADDQVFHRLAYALKKESEETLPMSEIFWPSGNFKAIISDNSIKCVPELQAELNIEQNETKKRQIEAKIRVASITQQNGSRAVGKYTNPSRLAKMYEVYNSYVNEDPNNSDISLSKNEEFISLLDEYFLVKDENNLATYPEIYHFGTISIPRGLWSINISRNKVLRICNILKNKNSNIDLNDIDVIMYIVTKNSIITEEEYNIIKEQIENARKRGVKLS